MLLLALITARDAHAQACVCSRNVALPSGNVLRPWAGIVSVEYGVSLSGEPALWQGASVTDRYGDSMAGMFMPPHVVQTGSVTATLGLPKHFAVSATVPYMAVHHLGESEMPGDVDSNSFADADVTAKWGHLDKKERVFYGASAGVTLPTGEVVADSPVRSGRGVFGASFAVNGGAKISPKVGIAGQISGSTGFGADPTGYTVGPAGSLVVGARWSPRENGRLNLALFAMERWAGTDRQDALVYKNTGYLTTDVSVAMTYTFWENKLRSASFSLRAQAPVWQVVGDPMYAENFGGSAGVSVVAF